MPVHWRVLFLIFGFLTLSGCQAHLPPLETEPQYPGPDIGDVIGRVQCELAEIVNAPVFQKNPDGSIKLDASGVPSVEMDKHDKLPVIVSDDVQLMKWVQTHPSLRTTLPYLVDYNFVATAQLSLEVTDTEGLNPSLSFITPYIPATNNFTFSVGGQLNGTQDRSIIVNYAVDLASLLDPNYKATYCSGAPKAGTITKLLEDAGLSGGIAGNLGLSDVVSAGLVGIDTGANHNLYASTGPTPLGTTHNVYLLGSIDVPELADIRTAKGGKIITTQKVVTTQKQIAISGTILFAPQSASASTQGSATLNGVATLQWDEKTTVSYAVSWTGNFIPPESTPVSPPAADCKNYKPDLLYYSFSGSLTPLPNANPPPTTALWGFNPTVTLTGNVNRSAVLAKLSNCDPGGLTMSLTGVLVPVAGTPAATNPMNAKVIGINVNSLGGEHGAVAAAASKSASTSTSSASGTSFGTLTDFVLVYGLNAGPNWTFASFKGPSGGGGGGASSSGSSSGGSSGGGQLLTGSRTNTDSISITFVASCQKFENIPSASPSDYWSSIGPCDQFNTAQQQSEAIGFQNNYLLRIQSLVTKIP